MLTTVSRGAGYGVQQRVCRTVEKKRYVKQDQILMQVVRTFLLALTVAVGESVARLVPVEDGGGGAKGESVRHATPQRGPRV